MKKRKKIMYYLHIRGVCVCVPFAQFHIFPQFSLFFSIFFFIFFGTFFSFFVYKHEFYILEIFQVCFFIYHSIHIADVHSATINHYYFCNFPLLISSTSGLNNLYVPWKWYYNIYIFNKLYTHTNSHFFVVVVVDTILYFHLPKSPSGV